jgi:uncharacterized membrane protein
MDNLFDIYFFSKLYSADTARSNYIIGLRSKLDDVNTPVEQKLFLQAKIKRIENFHGSIWINLLIIIVVLLICLFVPKTSSTVSTEWLKLFVVILGCIGVTINTYTTNQRRNKIYDSINMEQLNAIH